MDAIIRLIHFISFIKIGGKKQFDVKKNFEGEVCRILNVLPSAKRTICVTFLVATLITWVHWQYSPHWSMLVLLQTTFWSSTVSGLTYKKSSKNAIIRTKKKDMQFLNLMCLTEYQKYKQPIEKKNILKIKDEWILVIINDWTLISTCKASGGFLKWMVFTDARSSLWSLPLKWKFKKNSWNSFADSWKALGDSTFVCEGASRSATDRHCACGFHFDIVLELIIKS